MPDDGKPLMILPFGRDAETQDKLYARKAAGRRGAFGCLLWLFAFALVAVFAFGWMLGNNAPRLPDSNESVAFGVNRNDTERLK